MKTTAAEIKKKQLAPSFYKEHKDALVKSDFGLDGSEELIGGGFGLYSTANMKSSIGPFKTEFFRMGLMRRGHVKLSMGLEKYNPKRNYMAFGFPGQIFSLYEPTDDFFAYYILFKEDFIGESLLLKNNRERFPFLSYAGTQSFKLSDEEAAEVEQLYLKVNEEIKSRRPDIIRTIQLYIQLILIHANRSYERQMLEKHETNISGNTLYKRYVKLVSQHFLTMRKVSDYAGLLHVTSDHLNRTIKSQSEKTAHGLIDEMILIEAKAHLLQTQFTIAQIAYQLGFTDPSHFNKFFKKLAGVTPLQFRNK